MSSPCRTFWTLCCLWSQAKYVDPEKALEAKERGNEQFRAGQWALAISEYEEVSEDVVAGMLFLFGGLDWMKHTGIVSPALEAVPFSEVCPIP